MKEVGCFKHYDYRETHIIGDAECGGCSTTPTACSTQGCAGLVHSEACFDGDESGGWTWTEYFCDLCHPREDFEISLLDPDVVRQQWIQRDSKRKLFIEQARICTNPTPDEIADAWIQAAVSFFDWSNSQDWTNWSDEEDIDEDAIDMFAEKPLFSRATGPYPDLDSIRPKNAAGNPSYLFKHPRQFEIFAAFMAAVEEKPNEPAIRAAAIACYSKLSNFFPRDSETADIYDEDTEEMVERTYYWYDTSEEWEPHRTIFAGYLAQIVRRLNVRSCQNWLHTRWEISNACSAKDWDLVRRLFTYAQEAAQHSAIKLAALRAQFEYLLAYGPIIDTNLGLGPTNKLGWLAERLRGVAELRSDLLAYKPFSLHVSEPPTRLLKPGEDEFMGDAREYLAPVLFPMLSTQVPVLTAERQTEMEKAAKGLAEVIPLLGSSSLIYRSIVAQCYLALHQPVSAARFFESIGNGAEIPTRIGYAPYINENTLASFSRLSADIYKRCGMPDEAEQVLRSLVQRHSNDMVAWVDLAKIQWDVGNQLDAQASAKIARDLDPEMTSQEPLLQLLLRLPPPEIDVPTAIKNAQHWRYYSRLTEKARNTWRFAVGMEIHAAQLANLEGDYLRAAAMNYSKAVEIELRAIFIRFRNEVDASKRKATLQLEKNAAVGKNVEHFYSFLLNDGFLSMGHILAAIRESTTARRGALSDLNNYLRRYNSGLLQNRLLESLGGLKDMGNAERHDYLDPEIAKGAGKMAKRVLEEILG